MSGLNQPTFINESTIYLVDTFLPTATIKCGSEESARKATEKFPDGTSYRITEVVRRSTGWVKKGVNNGK